MTVRKWGFALGGLTVWAAHFFLLYGFASVFPGGDIARWLTIAATVPALAIDALLLRSAARHRSRRADGFDRWFVGLGAIGAGLSFVAVAWQALPALML